MNIDQTTDLMRAQSALDADQARLYLRQSEIAAEKHRRLELAHQELISQCRAAKQEVARLEREKESRMREWIQAQGAHENARQHVSAHAGNRPDYYSYPSVVEMETWRSELEQLRSEAGASERAASQANTLYRTAIHQAEAARDAFQSLVVREGELRTQLNPPRRGSGITMEVRDGTTAIEIARVA